MKIFAIEFDLNSLEEEEDHISAEISPYLPFKTSENLCQ